MVNPLLRKLLSTVTAWYGKKGDQYSDIYLYNFSTTTENQITANGKVHNPAIYGDRIVWADSRSKDSNVYMYDIFTSKETQISISGKAYYPAIYGDKIV